MTREELYTEYTACLSANQVVRTNEDGVVSLDVNGEPKMTGDQSACVEQNEKWNRAEVAFERRKKMRELESSRSCGAGKVLYCVSRGSNCFNRWGVKDRDCRCECVNRDWIFR